MELTLSEYIRKGKQFFLDKRMDLAIVCFESALLLEINDDELLMEVQNELGNAYQSINDYEKSFNIHKKNVDLAKSVNNYSMESISYASITIALTSMKRFLDAIPYCLTHLEFSKNFGNGLEIVQALFNMGNIYYYNAKTRGALFPIDSIQFPKEIVNLLETATEYYKTALIENNAVKDEIIEMKILGNYSNVHFLLGNFKKSIKLNTRKLQLAVELNDKESEKRSYLNRGNSYVFVKNYKSAIKDFKSALEVVRILKDVNSEVNLLYTLSNTYYISKNFESALESMINYRNLVIGKNNKQFECRANLCLCIIYCALEDYDMSEVYANSHLEISLELKNDYECEIANENLRAINDMKNYLEHKKYKLFPPCIVLSSRKKFPTAVNLPEFVQFRDLTDMSTKIESDDNSDDESSDNETVEEFCNIAYKFQLKKMKDESNDVNLQQLKEKFIDHSSSTKKIFLQSLANLQGDRMDDQRTLLPAFR